MNEALTQGHVWQVFPVRVARVYLAFQYGSSGFIVMEYVDGTICDTSDAPQAAAAVQSLIALCAPFTQPGSIGRGHIVHRFFIEWESSILATVGSVDLVPEVEAYGLRFCPSDLHSGNFMKDRQGRIVVLDFGASSFLSVSFFAFALCESIDDFTQRIARLVTYPLSTQLDALFRTHYALVPHMSNNIGLPQTLKRQVQ